MLTIKKNPPLQYKFVLSSEKTSSKDQTNIFFIFSDELKNETNEQIHIDVSLLDTLKLYQKQNVFSAKPQEIIYLPEHRAIAIGLGKAVKWHPIVFASAARKLGEFLKDFTEKSFTIHVSKKLLEVNNQYNILASQFKQSLNPSNKGSDSPVEAEPLTTHPIFPFHIYDLLNQLPTCMNIGSEKMAILKKSKIKQNDESNKKTVAIVLHESNETDSEQQKVIEDAHIQSKMLHGMRHITSLPGNILDPLSYAKYISSLADEAGLKAKILHLNELQKRGFGGIVAVGKGSEIPPVFAILEHNPKNALNEKPIVLVGKGVTFDTGGISLKPPPNMHEMKYDMCGSALALHSIAMAGLSRVPLRIVCLVALAENMPSASAIKPGDVYTAYNGDTIEVKNTDAEGRLVLGDALSYACKHYNPLCILDYATLTGACVVALGNEAAGVMTASERLAEKIQSASLHSLDFTWRLPHWSIYGEDLRSDIADISNILSSRGAGTISAMRFLANFVDASIPWAHFDIAGVAWRSKDWGSQCRNATGWGIRFMHHFLQDLVKDFER